MEVYIVLAHGVEYNENNNTSDSMCYTVCYVHSTWYVIRLTVRYYVMSVINGTSNDKWCLHRLWWQLELHLQLRVVHAEPSFARRPLHRDAERVTRTNFTEHFYIEQ